MIHPDDENFWYATDEVWDRAATLEIGAHHPERAWILTDRDVWRLNRFTWDRQFPIPILTRTRPAREAAAVGHGGALAADAAESL